MVGPGSPRSRASGLVLRFCCINLPRLAADRWQLWPRKAPWLSKWSDRSKMTNQVQAARLSSKKKSTPSWTIFSCFNGNRWKTLAGTRDARRDLWSSPICHGGGHFHLYPRHSKYGIFTYIWWICMVNVGKTDHTWSIWVWKGCTYLNAETWWEVMYCKFHLLSPIVKVETFDEAVAIENANPYGNAAAIYTMSGQTALETACGLFVGWIAPFVSKKVSRFSLFLLGWLKLVVCNKTKKSTKFWGFVGLVHA